MGFWNNFIADQIAEEAALNRQKEEEEWKKDPSKMCPGMAECNQHYFEKLRKKKRTKVKQ